MYCLEPQAIGKSFLRDWDLLPQDSATASVHDVLREVSPAVLDVGVSAHDRRQAIVLPAAAGATAADVVVVRLGAATTATAAGGVPGARASVSSN